MEHQPIKRSDQLKILSRDHHIGLLFSWKIKEGLRKNINPQRLKNYVNHFFDHHLKVHFRDEEVLLFDRFEEMVCIQAKKEHQQLLRQLENINNASPADLEVYEQLIKILNEHIRFEERVVFPHLEKVLPVATLNLVNDFLKKDEQRPGDDYRDEFWK